MMLPIGRITSSPMPSTSLPVLTTSAQMLTTSAQMPQILITSEPVLTTIGPLVRHHCRARDRRNLRPHLSRRRKKRPRLSQQMTHNDRPRGREAADEEGRSITNYLERLIERDAEKKSVVKAPSVAAMAL